MRFKKALITGATSGIGEALAKRLAKEGISLLLTGRNVQKLNLMKSQLEKSTPVEIFCCDIAEPADRQRLLKVVEEGSFDLVINNAGVALYGEAISIDLEKHKNLIELNCVALVEIATAAAKALRRGNNKGVILNVASVAAFYVFPQMATYSASKAFVTHFSEALDFELRPYGIRSLTSCPGKVRTELFTRASESSADYPEESYVMTAAFAADEIWSQICRGQRVRLFDFWYRLSYWVSRLLPTAITARFLSDVIVKRDKGKR